nr:MAG TPA: hypothetical protein [Bacteriophage sp.]DAK47124.1 MAG TPA: hypothetical protein [Caudoviricetes sp.]
MFFLKKIIRKTQVSRVSKQLPKNSSFFYYFL